MPKLRLLFLVALLSTANAHAHSGFGSTAPFWAGVLHFLVSPLALAALLGYCAWVVSSKKALDFKSIFNCAASAGFLSFYPSLLPDYILAVGVVLIGIAAMLRVKMPQIVIQVTGIFVGIIIGISTDLDNQNLLSAFGIVAVTLYLGVAFLGLWNRGTEIDWLNPILLVASRVLGSWVAAFSLLLAALGIQH